MREGAVLDGRYEIGPELGRGSTATVHRALDRTTGEDVAVKVFTTGPSPADAGRDRREIRILGALRHPGLVTFLDAGTADGERYVVTDLVDGRSLAEALVDGPMAAEDVAALGADLADALAYVHGQGVVHRDVKPANILLDRDGRPRLADFGIARLDGATKVTHTGVVIGTAAYMAPEQVRGHDVTAPADVYSLGLVLLEALTGEREFPGSAVEAAVARLHRPPRIPAAAGPGLTGVLRRMTAIAPSARPSADEVARLLRSLPEAGTARRGVRRLLPLAAAALLLCGLGTGYALSGPGTDATASTAPTPAAPPVDAAPGAGGTAPTITIVEAGAGSPAAEEPAPIRTAGGGGAPRAERPADAAPPAPQPAQTPSDAGTDADDGATTPPSGPGAGNGAAGPAGAQPPAGGASPAAPADDAAEPEEGTGGEGDSADGSADGSADESDDSSGKGSGDDADGGSGGSGGSGKSGNGKGGGPGGNGKG